MSTTATHPHRSDVDSPADRHLNAVLSMSRTRGRLLTSLLGPTDSLPPHFKDPIDAAGRDLDFALYELASGRALDAHRARYQQSRTALEAAVTEAEMSNWSLNTLRAMLDDFLREAEHMADLLPHSEPAQGR